MRANCGTDGLVKPRQPRFAPKQVHWREIEREIDRGETW